MCCVVFRSWKRKKIFHYPIRMFTTDSNHLASRRAKELKVNLIEYIVKKVWSDYYFIKFNW